MIFTVQETINASPETVWHHLTDPASMTRWMAGVNGMRTADGGPVAGGSDLIFIARGKERHSLVAAFEPMRKFTLQSTQGPVTATYVYTLDKADSDRRTIVRLAADCTARGWARIMMPLLKPAIRRADANQLSDLKNTVENPA